MFRFIQGCAPLLLLACGLCGASNALAAPEKPLNARDAEYRGFVIRGAIVDATALDVMVVDVRGEPLDGAYYELKDGAFEAVLPLPIGVEANIQLKALGRKGELLAEGSGGARFNDSRNGSTIIKLASADGTGLGTVLVSPIGLRLDRVDTGDPGLARYELHAFDADRREVEISPKEVSWEIPFPVHITYEPCKPSDSGIVPCIEFRVPVKNRLYAEIIACVAHNTCTAPEPPPPEPLTGYKEISAGYEHTCALTHDGRIFCWGANGQQQIARVTTETCRLPPPLHRTFLPCGKMPAEIACPPGSSCRYVELDAGFQHTCAIDTAGAVWCWGDNMSKQLGFSCVPGDHDPNCSETGMPRRVNVPGADGDQDPRFVQISAGYRHTCAVSAAGKTYCWGSNAADQLGSPGLSEPRAALSSNKYLRVSAGREHTCAVTTTGDLDCWGGNEFNRIEPGNPLQFYSTPTPIRASHPLVAGRITHVAANRFTTCVHADVSGVSCWGTGVPRELAVAGVGATDVELGFVSPSRVLTGDVHEACVVSAGEVLCGVPDRWFQPVQGSAAGFTDSTVGGGHYCGVMQDGSALCWGKDNTFGQMGDGTQANHLFPGPVLGP